MLTESITWKNAETDDFTDAELEAVGDYIWSHNNLVSKFTGYVFDDIVEECKNGLRSMGYKFECDNIGFDDGYADGNLENLRYVGDALDEFTTSSGNVTISPDIEFFEANSYGWVSYPNVSELEDLIRYDVHTDYDMSFGDYGLTFKQVQSMYEKEYIKPEDWEEIQDWNERLINTLESEYEPFIEDVQRLEKSFEDELTLRSREFFLTILESASVAFAFMPDGRVIDYEVNSSK